MPENTTLRSNIAAADLAIRLSLAAVVPEERVCNWKSCLCELAS